MNKIQNADTVEVLAFSVMKRNKSGIRERSGRRDMKFSKDGSAATPATVCRDIVSSIVGVYVFVILTVFPLFATDMYFDILVDKYYFFWISTALTLCACTLTALGCLFVDCNESHGEHFLGFFRAFSPKQGGLRQALKTYFRTSDWFLILFLVTALLSTVLSEWPYEAFWGNMGRYQGFFIWIWYAAAYFLITRFFKLKQWYLDAFLIAGLYLAIWGIQDYMALDPHGWLLEVENSQKSMFTSTIGNINTYTAVVALYMAVSSVLFVAEGSRTFQGDAKKLRWLSVLRTLFYGVAMVVFFTAMVTGQSDNAVLSVLALLCFLPFYAWKNARGFVRYFLVLAGFFLAMLITKALTLAYPNPNAGFWSGTLLKLCEKDWTGKTFGLMLLIAVLAYGAALLRGLRQERNRVESSFEKYDSAMERKLPLAARLIWLGLGILAAAGVVWLFWDANHGGHPEWYSQYANIFYFNNDWGTHRGHNWGILMRHIKEFPLWQKLIGAGPETYGIVTRVYDYNEMISMYGEVYDSPHNEFLQYLFTTGILGFVGYYGFIISNGIEALNIKRKPSLKQCGSPLAAAGVFAAAAYTVSSFINISVPIVVPLMLIILFIGSSEKRNPEKA